MAVKTTPKHQTADDGDNNTQSSHHPTKMPRPSSSLITSSHPPGRQVKTLVLTHRSRRKHASLLTLPPECRLRIYTHLLIPSVPIFALRHDSACSFHPSIHSSYPPAFTCALADRLDAGDYPRSYRTCKEQRLSAECKESCIRQYGRRRNLAVLRVSRLVYREAKEVLWGDERWGFTFMGFGDFVQSMKTIPPMGRERVRKLVIKEEHSRGTFRTWRPWSGTVLREEVWEALRSCPRLKMLELPLAIGPPPAGELKRLKGLVTLVMGKMDWITTDEGDRFAIGIEEKFNVRRENGRRRDEKATEEVKKWLQRTIAPWPWQGAFPEWMEKAKLILQQGLVHEQGRRDVMTVDMEDGSSMNVEFWGLPTSSLAEQKKLYLKEVRRPKEAQISSRTVPELPNLERSDHEDLLLMAQKADWRSKLAREDVEDHQAMLEIRPVVRNLEARVEVAKAKAKERRKMKRSVRELQEEKKAVAKRSGRRAAA